MLRGMGGASIGVWCAHGEGRAHFPSQEVKQAVLQVRGCMRGTLEHDRGMEHSTTGLACW